MNILRDSHGHRSGVVMEGAMEIVEQALPDPPIEVKFEWLQQAMHYLNRFGITSATMATGSLADIELYGKDAGSRAADAANAHRVRRRRREPPPDAAVPGRSGERREAATMTPGSPPTWSNSFPMASPIRRCTRRGAQQTVCGVGQARLSIDDPLHRRRLGANGSGCLSGRGEGQRASRSALSHGTRRLPEPGGLPRFRQLSVIASMQPGFCCNAASWGR
jgi:hypothetical protein